MLIDSLSPLAPQLQWPGWLFCQLLSAWAWRPACQDQRLHTTGARRPYLTSAQAATLPPGLGRPFQSANNTGEFKLIQSAFPEANGRKGFLKGKGLREEVSKGLPGLH